MAVIPLPDTEFLRQCLNYDPETGVLTWKHRPIEHFCDGRVWAIWNSNFSGTQAGNVATGKIAIAPNVYHMHRIIWKMMTGTDPEKLIDHHDRDRCNNRWNNLRPATFSQNNRNAGVRSHSVTGLKGVGINWEKVNNIYYAVIRVEGRNRKLGYFATPEMAHAAYCKAAKAEFGDYWNPGLPHPTKRKATSQS